MPSLQVVHSSVEPIGAVRLVPTGEPVEMEFAAEVLRMTDVVVDVATQAVLDDEAGCVELSWLHPRGDAPDPVDVATTYVDHGVLAPLTHAVNEFYLLVETCAGLYVCDRAGVLAGAELVGARPPMATFLLEEGVALYGCAVPDRSARLGRIRVGELYVPRFWVRPAGSGEGHFDAPHWAAAGYSRAYLADLRSRLLEVPAPEPSIVAFSAQEGAELTDGQVTACHAVGAVVLPGPDGLGLAARAALYARVRALVAMHDESNVNAVFLPDGAVFDEVFAGGETPGQFAILAGLRGLDYSATVVPADEDRSADDLVGLGPMLAARAGDASRPSPVVYLLTGVWDNADLLDDWLEHHRRLGVAGVLAMDFGSTDGSVELLRSPRWSGFVDLVPFPGLKADHSALLVQAARGRWLDGWGLLIDPDEFLVTATGDLAEPTLLGAMAAADLVTLPRFELTAPRSTAVQAPTGRPDASDLTLRLAAQDQGKVMVDLASDATASLSAHEGAGHVQLSLSDPRTCLLHAPVRSFERYEQKVDHAATTLAVNDHLDEGFAWHWRRWVAVRDEGGLPAEYLAQFVADDAVDGLLADGTYVPDPRLAAVIDSARDALAEQA